MKRWHLVLIILLLLVLALWATERRGRSVAEARATAQADSAQAARAVRDRLQRTVDSLEGAYAVDTVRLTRWRTRWDSIVGPGRTDTLTIERVIGVADSTILSCTAAVTTCEQRVATVTEQRDSAVSEAGHWEQSAAQWKKIARGPWLALAVEGTVTTGLVPQGAGEVTLGRGHLKVLGRVEVGEGAETCAFLPNTEAYSCSAPVEAVARAGVRWTF